MISFRTCRLWRLGFVNSATHTTILLKNTTITRGLKVSNQSLHSCMIYVHSEIWFPTAFMQIQPKSVPLPAAWRWGSCSETQCRQRSRAGLLPAGGKARRWVPGRAPYAFAWSPRTDTAAWGGASSARSPRIRPQSGNTQRQTAALLKIETQIFNGFPKEIVCIQITWV